MPIRTGNSAQPLTCNSMNISIGVRSVEMKSTRRRPQRSLIEPPSSEPMIPAPAAMETETPASEKLAPRSVRKVGRKIHVAATIRARITMIPTSGTRSGLKACSAVRQERSSSIIDGGGGRCRRRKNRMAEASHPPIISHGIPSRPSSLTAVTTITGPTVNPNVPPTIQIPMPRPSFRPERRPAMAGATACKLAELRPATITSRASTP